MVVNKEWEGVMSKALKIIAATLFLLLAGPHACGGGDGGCKVDFDCPGSKVCVESKCQPLVCTSNAACIDPSLVCVLNQCVPADPPVDNDTGAPPIDQGVATDEGNPEDGTVPPEDDGALNDTSAPEDVPSTEDIETPVDTAPPTDEGTGPDDDGPEPEDDGPEPDDEGSEPEDEGPVPDDEGFTQCGEVNIVGCCSTDNIAKTCTSEGLAETDCGANGETCGWSSMGFYNCDSEGLADPDGNHPFLCPGEVCEGSCDGKNCGTDGCGNSCGVCEGGTTCNLGSGICEEDEPVEDPPTYYEHVQPILLQFCGGCHSGGGSGGHDIASNYVDAFKTSGSCGGIMVGPCALELINNGSMPPGPLELPPGEIQIIDDWVNGGMLEGPAP